MQAADATALRPGLAHPPLSAMLVLTQFGVGAVGASAVVDPRAALPAWLALGATAAGVIAATLHLGQPLKAWRSLLGWRRSWLSRELLAFGAVVAAMSGHALLLQPGTAWSALLTGFVAVTCSAMIYVDTRRAFWSAWLTFPKFALTTVILGAASALMCCALTGDQRLLMAAALTLLAAASLKIGMEIGFVSLFSSPARKVGQSSGLSSLFFRKALASPKARSTDPMGVRWGTGETPALHKSALLHTRVLRGRFLARLTFGLTGGALLPALLFTGCVLATLPLTIATLILCVVGEVTERHLFFVCEAAPRMPGGGAG